MDQVDRSVRMEAPKVTVLMSIYNGEKFLRESIESILGQTFTNFEFIIVDDGSTDSSNEIIRSYDDPRICLVENEKNIGLTKSLNKGIDLCRGKYIARMDADDISLSKRIEKQILFMDQNPTVGVCGSWVNYFRSGKKTVLRSPSDPEEIKANLFFRNIIFHPTVIFRKDLPSGDSVSYNENYLRAQDYELWARLVHLINFSNINEVLVKLRSHSNTVYRTDRKSQVKYGDKVKTKQIQRLGINASRENIRLHKKILNSNHSFSLESLNDAGVWLLNLLQYNNRREIYDKYYFRNLIQHYWFLICTSSTEYGMEVYKIFNGNESLSTRNLSLNYKLRFFLKCLLKFNSSARKSYESQN